MGLAGGWRDEVGQALREDATRACRIPAHELPHGELNVNLMHAPGEIGQVALVTAMH